MQGYNLIVVYSKDLEKILMCIRRNDPFKGLSNFIGGKIENGEDGLHAAYRELEEETSITQEDIVLTHFMDIKYYSLNYYMEIYVGKLNKAVSVFGDENDLYWSTLDNDFFDVSKYAGEGNIGHILKEIDLCKEKILH